VAVSRSILSKQSMLAVLLGEGVALLIIGDYSFALETLGITDSPLIDDPFASEALWACSMTLLLVGLLALFQSLSILNPLGKAGLLVALFGIVLILAISLFSLWDLGQAITLSPESPYSSRFSQVFDGNLGWSSFHLGWLLFGWVILRSRAFPRIAAVLLVIGAALNALNEVLLAFLRRVSFGDVSVYELLIFIADPLFAIGLAWVSFTSSNVTLPSAAIQRNRRNKIRQWLRGP
jgi:hypothetical protein